MNEGCLFVLASCVHYRIIRIIAIVSTPVDMQLYNIACTSDSRCRTIRICSAAANPFVVTQSSNLVSYRLGQRNTSRSVLYVLIEGQYPQFHRWIYSSVAGSIGSRSCRFRTYVRRRRFCSMQDDCMYHRSDASLYWACFWKDR